MNFDNGSEAIARVPSKLAGPPFLTTASEVATLEFAREVLGISAPRVFAWNARADRDPVGAEYIIMEKMGGDQLLSRWLEVAGKDAVPIFDDTLKIEKSFESVEFASIGSLYFKEDVSSDLQAASLFAKDHLPHHDSDMSQKLSLASEKYRVGPIADRQWWRGERLGMTADRGPWRDLPSFLGAAINLERSWITHYAAQNITPSHRRAPYYDPSAHFRILDMYTQVIPYIVPPPSLCMPTLWHPELSFSNLRVVTSGPAHIVAVIDWQHAIVAPYLMQAHFPSLFVYEGDRIPYLSGLFVPQLPDEVATFPPEEQELYKLELRLAKRQKLYEMYIRQNKYRSAACSFPLSAQLAMLPYNLVRSWTDSPVALRQILLDIRGEWEGVAPSGVPCPISFTDQEIQEHKVEYECYLRYGRAVEALNVELGCTGDGTVPPELYVSSMKNLETTRDSWDKNIKGGPFPYSDGMFSFFLN